MKYIDADELKAKVKEWRNKLMGFSWEAVNEVLRIIDSLQQEQPSLPDNLDEAAREIVIKMHPCMEDCTILGDRLTCGQLMALVKAGAELMAGQGVSTVTISSTEDGITEEGMKLISDYLESLPDKTEVVLQIRKKQ